ncbi:MAG: MOSC domain-containing protein [Planctomycetota bacterium]|nr:MAG: MOSC domain-containing protein [Planctomycetota bacterium]
MIEGLVVSVNVGLPRVVEWKGKSIETAIFKSPVAGRVKIRRDSLEGDQQADRRHHGGTHKAVYSYAHECYTHWRAHYPQAELLAGAFGENLTTQGLTERAVCIGDRFRFGTALLEASEPRLPCAKLALRFGSDEIVEQFLAHRHVGIYWRIVEDGDVATGDRITLVERTGNGTSVHDVIDAYVSRGADASQLERALACTALTHKWRNRLRRQADQSGRPRQA